MKNTQKWQTTKPLLPLITIASKDNTNCEKLQLLNIDLCIYKELSIYVYKALCLSVCLSAKNSEMGRAIASKFSG